MTNANNQQAQQPLPCNARRVTLTGKQAESALLSQTRRKFLTSATGSLGSLALGSMLGNQAFALPTNSRGSVGHQTHFTPRARRVIHLCMAGGPSQFETLDPKPIMAKRDGQPMPESLTKGQPIAQLQGKALRIMGPQYDFSACGESGIEIANSLPNIQAVADDLCVVRSMLTQQINHDPAHTYFNTGSRVPGYPSVGAWLMYGLGSSNENLPGFVVMTSEGGGQGQPIASRQWSSGFLPSRYQGVKLNSIGEPVYFVQSPDGITNECQSEIVQAIIELNQEHSKAIENPEIADRIAQYELAFKMQTEVPDLADCSDESQATLELYGCKPGDGSYASNCLMARRLAERGVRFIQLYHRGWDHHSSLREGIKNTAKLVDQATAALITDLKQRGLLEDTLIIWGGEFGRTPMAQGSGRDHHIRGYSLFLAGAGVRNGTTYGATDELGYNAVKDPVHVRDLHATMLHLLGIDHQKLTFKHQGLDAKLTGVEPASVIDRILL